jgi:hypothetical protein
MGNITYKKENYPSLVALHAAEAVESVSYDTFYDRYKKSNWDLEKALTAPVTRKIKYKGKFYPTLIDLHAAESVEGVTYNNFYNRHKTYGWDLEKALTTPAREKYKKAGKKAEERSEKETEKETWEYKGKTYRSFSELVRKEGVEGLTPRTAKLRRKAGWSLEKALKAPLRRRTVRKYHPGNQAFETLEELAEAAGITYKTAVYRKNQGYSDEEIFYGRERKPKGTPITVNDTTYPNRYLAYQALKPNTSYRHVLARLKNDWTPEEAFGLEPRKGVTTSKKATQKYHIGDQKFSTRQVIADTYQINLKTLESRLQSMSLEEAVNFQRMGGYSRPFFERNPGIANGPGILYFVRVNLDEGVLHKVGITRRSTEMRFVAEDVEVIAEFMGKLGDLFEIEQKVIEQFSILRYRPDERFDGETETFLLTEEEEAEMLKVISAYVEQLDVSA